jgi:hypothetical protein
LSFDAPEVTGNRATRRAAARRGRKLAALGSGAILASGLAVGAVAAFPSAAGAATTITVANTNDSGAGSLRDALANANTGDTIDLTGVTGTITLATGQLEIDVAVTIQGPGASLLTVSGNGASRVFNMDEDLAGGTVTIAGLTVTGGNDSEGGGVYFDCDRGSGSFILSDSVVTGNTADDLGGGLYFDECDGGGTMSVLNSVVSNNTSTSNGAGGIWFDQGDSLTIQNSTISGNHALDGGGGGVTAFAYDAGGVTVTNSTISGNTAAHGGGGMYLWSPDHPIVVANSTVTGNTASEGGGIKVSTGTIDLEQSTVSGNTAVAGGDGLYLGYSNQKRSATSLSNESSGQAHAAAEEDQGIALVTGSIVAGNDDGTSDIGGAEETGSSVTTTASVIGTVTTVPDTDGGGNQLGVTNPGLASLADNGGPTQTMALVAGSPAIDAGPDPVPSFPGNEFDQRGAGFPRVVGNKVDVGAFEVQAPAPAPDVVVVTPRFTG